MRFRIIAAVLVTATGVACTQGNNDQASSNAPRATRSAVAVPPYVEKPGVSLPSGNPLLTAVDPLAYVASTDVIPARPFVYSVDSNGLTITRFNDNAVVGTVAFPPSIWVTLPDGSNAEIPAPAGGWEPVGMVVSYPTDVDLANRVKEIPDLTPPWTFVYVVMAHSGYEWQSNPSPPVGREPNVRDTIVPSSNPETESALLVQINVNDPSFSTRGDGVAPSEPHVAGAFLGHGAGQPVYDRKNGTVYVGNLPSNSLPADLASFVSVIRRIPDTVAATEAEIPGISKPVIRCGPQHPESGIPVGKPQAYACYDPGGQHSINDNEHVGSFGNYEWEFRNLPPWLTAHLDKVTGQLDGILYGTPPETGEWYAEARVHNLDDEYGVFSDWTPIRLLVTPSAEYLPIRAHFAVGEPVSYPLEGTGLCTLVGAPSWVDVAEVPNGCVVMGRAPISGEHYAFAMPGFTLARYPEISVVFSGNVVGPYHFDPLPQGVGLSGLAWHQVEKYADPSTETAVLSLEFIGVEPSSGQLYQILQPPGMPQPPNERPAETALGIDVIEPMGLPLETALLEARPDLAGHLLGFGEVAVEADRDIFVAALTDSNVDGALMKVSGALTTTINLPGVQAHSLGLDSDLRPAIIGVEPGQVDHGILWVTGSTSGNVAVVDTNLGILDQSLAVSGASALGAVSPDFGTQYAYVAALQSLAIFAPEGSTLPPMRPRIWSSEELTFNRGLASVAPIPFRLMATGDPLPMTLSLLGELPDGVTFVDNGDGTAEVSGIPGALTEGDYALAVTATNATGSYAQAFGISVNIPPEITSGNAATFIAGAAGSFTITGTGSPTPIFFTWDETSLPPGMELIDNENGTASLAGTPETPGTYEFALNATTGCPPDATQTFTVTVNPAAPTAPALTGPNTTTWATVGAPFPPDPFTVTSTGSPTPALTVEGTLPFGVTFVDNGNSTGTMGGGCQITWPGMDPSCLTALFDGTEGTYNFTIRASNGVPPDATMEFTLVVERNLTLLTAAPATMVFDYTAGGTLPAPQILSVGTTGEEMPYAAVTTATWLHATPVSGTLSGTPIPLTISVDVSGLAAGTYSGTVIVTSAGTEGPFATSLVTLTVSDVPLLRPTPGTMSFEYTLVPRRIPPAQTVSLTSGGVPLSYTVSTSADWLVATPASGTTPASISVSVDASHRGVGTYLGTVTIDAEGAANGPQTISVILLKTVRSAGDFSISLSMDVGGGPEGLAINRNTHQVFINTSNQVGEPGSEAGSETGAETESPANPAEGNAVFRFDPSTGTVVGRTLVHSEGEYVGVNSKTGRVYHASQGTAEIAVIDGKTDRVLGFIPLLFADGPYSPYQIAIDEAQNIIYVGAHAPPIPDPIPIPGQSFRCKAIHEMPDDEYDCWNPGKVFVIDGNTNRVVSSFLAGDDPEGVVFAAATGKVYASNEDDGSITVAQGAKRNADGSIIGPRVLSTIIRGSPHVGSWHPPCNANNYCGERGQAALWPDRSLCNGIDDEAEEADKMAVDPHGDVYIIDDRYRVAKINGQTDYVIAVLGIEGFDCEAEVPDGSAVVFRNTANNIAFSGLLNPAEWHLYVTSEQDTVSQIDPVSMKLEQTLTIPGAGELDAITTDPALNRIFITDEELGALWILQSRCAGGTPAPCPP